MELLLHRFRNLTVLLAVIAAQLLLLAYQVKSNQDMRLIRVWAVTAVTPLARVLEGARSNSIGFVKDYFVLLSARAESQRLKDEVGRLKMENQYLRNELSTADRAQALSAFQAHTPSKTLAARIIANGVGANSRVVFVDRGMASGVLRGMAVVTPDGIVGRVVASYPTASQVMLVTDATFAAGVVAQKSRVHGTARGQGHAGSLLVDYIENEVKVQPGEWFFTSGDDRVFPKGFPVGDVKAVRPGKTFQEVLVTPSGLQHGLEEVLIVIEGVHQAIPDAAPAGAAAPLLPPPPSDGADVTQLKSPSITTEADRLREKYRKIGEAQGIAFGAGNASRIPDFNVNPDQARPKPTPAAAPPKTEFDEVEDAPAAANPPARKTPPAPTPEGRPAPARPVQQDD